MYDIYKIEPIDKVAVARRLKYTLIAGGYEEWGDMLFAILLLHNLVIKMNMRPMPVFIPQICVHRKTSTHYRTNITHIAPVTEEELRSLILMVMVVSLLVIVLL